MKELRITFMGDNRTFRMDPSSAKNYLSSLGYSTVLAKIPGASSFSAVAVDDLGKLPEGTEILVVPMRKDG